MHLVLFNFKGLKQTKKEQNKKKKPTTIHFCRSKYNFQDIE